MHSMKRNRRKPTGDPATQPASVMNGVDLGNRRASLQGIYECLEGEWKTTTIDVASLQQQISAHLLAKAMYLEVFTVSLCFCFGFRLRQCINDKTSSSLQSIDPFVHYSHYAMYHMYGLHSTQVHL